MATTPFHRRIVSLMAIVFAASVAAQTPALSRAERDQLQALLSATDAAASLPETGDASLRLHLMRAADGSHYVAYTVEPASSTPMPGTPVAVYVRLASARSVPAQKPERSLVRDWLAGNQAAPAPVGTTKGIALGEMPIMGPSNVERRPPQTPEMANLTLLDLERRRSRERQEERERQRRLELEGRAASSGENLPFEDFDLSAAPQARAVQRALTAGPGDYFLYVAWADRSAGKPTTPVVVKKRVTLPPVAANEFTIGSIILADGVRQRNAVYPASEQAAHPYSFGRTEILPSSGSSFQDNQDLSAVFQVINPQSGDNGKPNVDLLFEVVRVAGNVEQPIAALTPQNYSGATLPPEFDLRAGHPLFATVSAPLASLKRGDYRLKVLANDKVGGRTATVEVAFTVTATATALLRDAPPLARRFEHDSMFNVDVLPQILTALRPGSPSPALRRAFDLAGAGRFADLLVEEPVDASEEGVRAAMRGLAQLSVGDGSAAVQFQRAQVLGAPMAMTRFLFGAARAMQGQDATAIAAWQEALKIGAPPTLIVPPLVDAYLRRNDFTRAAALIGDGGTTWSRSVAATLIGTQKEKEAIAMLDAHLAATPADSDARWLLLHALFARIVRDPSDSGLTERFKREARAYIDANGANATLAGEWLAALK